MRISPKLAHSFQKSTNFIPAHSCCPIDACNCYFYPDPHVKQFKSNANDTKSSAHKTRKSEIEKNNDVICPFTNGHVSPLVDYYLIILIDSNQILVYAAFKPQYWQASITS